MNDDYLTERLRSLCASVDVENDRHDPLEGRYVVAKTADVNEQYLYQILTGKSAPDGKKRSVGKRVRDKITSAYPWWLDEDKQRTRALPPDMAEFVTQVMIESTQRNVPEHIRQSILTLITSSPKKDETSSS